jgi:hypothetical protein
MQDIQQVKKTSRNAINLVNTERVAFAQRCKTPRQLFTAFAGRATPLLFIDQLAPQLGQGIELHSVILILRTDPRITNQHKNSCKLKNRSADQN